MKLILVRHGETIENNKLICQGQRGGHLSKKGIAQAKKLARRLKKEHFDIIYCSDLKRTKDTLKEIRKYHPRTKCIYSKELRERCFGVWQGRNFEELQAYLDKKKLTLKTLRPKGGETSKQKQDRAVKFVKKVTKENPYKTVLFVTHGGIIWSLLRHFLNLTWKQSKKIKGRSNAGITIIETDGKKHKVHLMNCVKHLK
jgi:alpha-ribazole phosphatase